MCSLKAHKRRVDEMKIQYLKMCIYILKLLVCLIPMLGHTHSFQIIESNVGSYNNDTLKVGDTVTLKCVASEWYEYCSWKHENQICTFEWKRSFSEVRKQDCDGDMKERIQFLGNYNDHECLIELSNVSLSDAGEWMCELESYLWGPISGTKDRATLNLIVDSDLDYNETLIDSKEKVGGEEGKTVLFIAINNKVLPER